MASKTLSRWASSMSTRCFPAILGGRPCAPAQHDDAMACTRSGSPPPHAIVNTSGYPLHKKRPPFDQPRPCLFDSTAPVTLRVPAHGMISPCFWKMARSGFMPVMLDSGSRLQWATYDLGAALSCACTAQVEHEPPCADLEGGLKPYLFSAVALVAEGSLGLEDAPASLPLQAARIPLSPRSVWL